MKTAYALFTGVLLIIFADIMGRGNIVKSAGDTNTEKARKEAVSDLRDKFRKKFGKSSLRKSTQGNPTEVITVIKQKEIVGDDGIKTVTEKVVYHAGEKTEHTEHTNVFTSTANITKEQCNCVCPKVDGSNNYSRHGVTRLKFVRTDPEVLSPQDVEETEQIIENSCMSTNRVDARYVESCAEAMRTDSETSEGLYTIYIADSGPIQVYCYKDPLEKHGCAWTIFSRRITPGPHFDRTWNEYVKGFGDISGNFFLGLHKVHILTAHAPQELAVFTNFHTNDVEREKYGFFSIGNCKSAFQVLRLGKFSETSAIRHLVRDSKFSTKDKDNGNGYDSCAKGLQMGWWYSDQCKYAMQFSGVHAYLNTPSIMGLRPINCEH
ncbi:fibrinogen-like protein A [Eurosta solidaginis]|uniref:fibrinogen-like protein A n=1 Tax=Eurosta solidaginis TaxID=178769 RepID=UPI003530807A